MIEPRQPQFPYDSTLPLLGAFIGALAVLGVIAVVMSGGSDSPPPRAAAVTTARTTIEPFETETTTPAAPAVPVTLVVTTAGDGHGTIIFAGASRDCSDECRMRFDQGEAVKLVARAASGAQFIGWTGPCGSARTCTVPMDHSREVTALFALASPSSPPPPPAVTNDCQDGIDNDGDGLVDDDDPDCLTGDSEAGTQTTPPPAVTPPAVTPPPPPAITTPTPPVVPPPPPPIDISPAPPQ